ncbi:hypothetical protein OH77DRAFT_1239384 [Trametes cingulata]|nr:hypothetical protein OH77DRAFT_1239384 [Trametes cingulata]
MKISDMLSGRGQATVPRKTSGGGRDIEHGPCGDGRRSNGRRHDVAAAGMAKEDMWQGSGSGSGKRELVETTVTRGRDGPGYAPCALDRWSENTHRLFRTRRPRWIHARPDSTCPDAAGLRAYERPRLRIRMGRGDASSGSIACGLVGLNIAEEMAARTSS